MRTKNILRSAGAILAMLPALPWTQRRRRNARIAYAFAGAGIAILGGISALLLFSPRTRRRALGAAKDAYGKVNERVKHVREREAGPSNASVLEAEGITTSGL